MRFPSRQQAVPDPGGVTGVVRMDRRLGTVLRKAHPGDIAVVDQLDLDRAGAEALLERGVVAVVDASSALSGRFPNLGPELLVRSGVALVDEVGPEVFSRLKDGARARVHEGRVYVGDEAVVSGRPLGLEDVLGLMDAAAEGLTTQLQSLTHNTTEFLRREQDLLLHGQGLPDLDVEMADRPVVVVVRDFDHAGDLRRLRGFIRDQRPVLVGVDGGADSLLAARLTPDVVVVGEHGLSPGTGQAEPVSDRALTSAREVVLHADGSDRLPGAERLDRLGVRSRRVSSAGTTEDIALLIAADQDAATIVTVGTHATLDEFLDRHRAGLASTFLTRLRVGPRLVDAKAVPTLYGGRVRTWQLVLVLLAGLLALAVAVSVTPRGQDWVDDLLSATPVADLIGGPFP